MAKDDAVVSKDCFPCRAVSAAGLVGIGAYLANHAWKNQTIPGKITISAFSLTFVSLGIARYNQTYPFDKNKQKV